MTTYRVQWEIDIEAETPADAAREALAIQRRHNSIALVFKVTWSKCGESGGWQLVDLWSEPNQC